MPHKTTPKYKKHKLMDPVENLEDYICQKHERPLELFCRDDQTCVCQFCTEGDHRTHSTVPIEEESGEKKTQLEKTQAEVQQMIQERLKKIEEIKHSVELNKIYPSLCRPPHTKNWTDVSVNTPLSVESLRRALSQLQEHLTQEMEKIELRRIQQYAVDVTLDPDTAHPNLILSDDEKQVTHGDKQQKLPDNPERFDTHIYVLGKEGFSSGRFYYEVQVSGKTKWDLGVTRESSKRKGEITLSPEDGYWTVRLNETKYKALDSPRVLLWLNQAPQKVGVFVDYEEGLVSFYDVEVRSHIYSFTGQSFTEKLFPFFNPCFNDGGKNSAPLIITPVQHD
ncbi:zinc finger protein RFP-like [Astyanax mexicanus]|uniref:zinc finger protein RFP-like n=1 Tax=Astyanax mexicanus TaxID=7994 RepID=UPI0020CB27D1|nr:zinc finger protein RFP-like [Astyanax mexicanus]